ncbi:Thioredoxin domain-containing protein [Fusarium keratoplasticum]|uniref:Thioredoxin domain-containing protein n=1 Tax=Fusarium keratoplasticum TaxID=1328300 RepID=A0ACC0QWT8_9HYPO|nr:Thioredoxin domain-containing protein [Fusarium keratoplasticum]KAI8669444.1 Thioredoxin domain-containing protein [Fusarium keratoplasticum]KAI8674043.1 Thioredoxin domain-containing protein [Fusarium keratoplasticum]
MPVELRKRKAREPPAPPPAPAKKRTPAAKTGKAAATKVKAAPAKAPGKRGRPAKAKVEEEPAKEEEEKKEEEKVEEEKEEEKTEEKAEEPKETKKKSDKAEVGDVVDLDGFGGEIETNDGEKTTLKALVDESKAGVVLFTYPKASTPGCTKQVCFFRDSYEPLTAGGLAIYGLSTDSPKANTTFKDKQKLPYPLLCDPKATLIGAIGLKKVPKGTQRGVFVIDKEGKVLVAEPGSPQGTVDRVKKLVEELGA